MEYAGFCCLPVRVCWASIVYWGAPGTSLAGSEDTDTWHTVRDVPPKTKHGIRLSLIDDISTVQISLY